VDLAHTSAGNPVAGADNDLLSVTGDVFLGGATLTGSVAASVQPFDRFTILQTTGGTIQGSFVSGTSVVLGGITFHIDTSDPTRVVLPRQVPNGGEQPLSYHQNSVSIDVSVGSSATIAGSAAFFLKRDLNLSLSSGGLFFNFIGMNEKWLQGNANAFGNPWHF